ncbi:mucin-17 [Penaeus vannamei]|uniref:mucin-17 n=1 Tax=Penaeus vannamei TaxID=6689 RepID=UPI00387F51DA
MLPALSVLLSLAVLTAATSSDLETPASQVEDPAYPDQLAQESITLHTLASPEDLGVRVLPAPKDVEGLASVVPSVPSAQVDATSSVGNSVATDDPAEVPELPHPDQIAQESQVESGGDGLSTPTLSFPSPITGSSPHPSLPSGGLEGVPQGPHFPPNQYPQNVIPPTSPRFFNPHGQAFYPFPGPDGYPAIDPYRFYDQQRFYDQLRRPVDPSKIPPRRTSYNPHPVLPGTIFAPPERPLPFPPRRIKPRQPVNVREPLPRPTPQTPTSIPETSENQASSDTNKPPSNEKSNHTKPEVPLDVTTPLFQPKREQWNSKIFFEIEQSRQQLEESKQRDTEDSASLSLPAASAEEHSGSREQSGEIRPEEGLDTETSTEDRPKASSSEENQESTLGNAEIPIRSHEDSSPLLSSAEKPGITFFPQDVDEVFQFEGSERDVSAAKPNGNGFVQPQPTPTDLRDIDASLYEGLRLPYYSILDEPGFPNGNQQIFEALKNVDPSTFNEAVLAFEPQRTSEAPVEAVGSNVQQNLGIPAEPVTQNVDTGIPASTPVNSQPQPSQQNLPQLQANSQFSDFYDPGFLDYINALYRAQTPDYDYFYDYDTDYNIGSTGQFPGNPNSVPPQLQGGIQAATSGRPSLPPTGPLFNPWAYSISPTSPTRGSQTGAGFPQQFFPQNIPFPTGFPAQGVNGNQTQGFPFNPLGFQQQGILPFGYNPTPTTFVPGFQSSPQIPVVTTPRIRFQDDTVLEISPSPNPPVGVTNSIEIQTPPSISFETSTPPTPQTNEDDKADDGSVTGISQSAVNSLTTSQNNNDTSFQTQVVPSAIQVQGNSPPVQSETAPAVPVQNNPILTVNPQQNIPPLPPSTFASPVQVPLPNDSLPTVSQATDALQSPGTSDQAVPVASTGPAQNTLLAFEESGALREALGSVVPVKNAPIASPIQPQNSPKESESAKPHTVPATPTLPEQNIPGLSEIALNNVPSIPAVSVQNELISVNPMPNVSKPSAVPTQAAQLPAAFPTQNAPLPSAIPTQGIPLSSIVPTQDVQRPATIPSLNVPSQNARLPSAVPTQGIPQLSVVPTQGIPLSIANGTQGLQQPSTLTTQNAQLTSGFPPQNVQQPSSVQTQNGQLPPAVPTQGGQRPLVIPTQGVQLPSAIPARLPSVVPIQGVQLPSAVPTQGVQLPSAVPTQGVQLPSAIPARLPSVVPIQGVLLPAAAPTQSVQLPSAVPTQGVQLPSAVPTQGVPLPSAVPTQGVQLPSAVPTQGVPLPSAVPTQGVQLPSAVPTQGVQLPSAVPTQGVQLPSPVSTQGVQLPSAVPIQGVQLPSAVPTQDVQLPSAVPTQGIQLPSAIPTLGVQLPSAVPTQGVQLPSAVPTLGVQLPSVVPTLGVQLPSAVPTQGVQLPSAVPTLGVQLPSAVPTKGVQLPSAVPTKGVQLPSAVPTQGVQFPSAVPTKGVQLPSAVPIQGVQLPSAVPTQGVQLPSAIPTKGVQLPSAVPIQGVQLPSAVPTQGVQLPSAVPTQGAQLPSAVPTQGVQLPSAVPTQGVQLPSAVPTQGVQLPSAVPTQGVQLPSTVPTQGVQLPSAVGVQLPSLVSTQGVQLPSVVPVGQRPSAVSTQFTPQTFRHPTKGIQSPTVSSQGIQLPSLVPAQNQSPAVPVQSKQLPSIASTQGIQLPSAFPTEGVPLSPLVPVEGARPPSAVPTQSPSQRVPIPPSQGVQILTGFLGPLSQTTLPPSGLPTLPPVQGLENTLLIPISPGKDKPLIPNLPGNNLPEVTQVEDKTNTIGNVVTRPPLSVLTPRPPTAVPGTDPIKRPATRPTPATPSLQTEAFNDFMNFFGLSNGETSTLNPTTTKGSNDFAVGSGLVVDSKVLQDLHNLKNLGPRQDTTTRSYPLDPSLLNSTRLFANLAEAIRNTINPSYFILTKHDVGNYSSPPLIRQHKQSVTRLPTPKSVSETDVPEVENSSRNALKGTGTNAKMPHLIASLQAMMEKSPKQPQDSEEDKNNNGKNENEKEYSGGSRVGAEEFLLLFSNKSPILPDDGEYIILIPRPTELKFPTDTRPSAETTADIFTQGREFLDFAEELRADRTIKPHSAVRRRAPTIDPAEERMGPVPSSGDTEDPLEHPVRGAFYGLSTDPATLNWLAPYSGGFGLREPRKEGDSGERTEKKIDDAQTNSSNLVDEDYEDFPLAESNTLGVASPPTLLPEDLQGLTLAEYYAKYFPTAQDPQVFFNPLATGSYPAPNSNSPRPTIAGVRSPEQYGYFYQGQYPQFNLGANPYDFALANFPTGVPGQDGNAYSPNQTPQDTTPADNIGNRAPAVPELAEEGTSTTEPTSTPDYAYDEVGGVSYDYQDSSVPDYINGGNQDYASDTTFDSVYPDYDVQLESINNSTGLPTINPLVVDDNTETGPGDTFGSLDADFGGLRVNGEADLSEAATQRPDFPTTGQGANTSILDTLETVLSRNREDFGFNSDVPDGENVRYDQGILDAIIGGEVGEGGLGPSGNIPLDYDYTTGDIAPGGIPLPSVTEVPVSSSSITPIGSEANTNRSSFSESADGNSANGLDALGTDTSGGVDDPRFTNVPVDILVFTAAPTSGFQSDSNGLTPDDNIFTSQTKRVTPESNIFTSLASRFTPESNIFTSQGNVFTPGNAFTTELSVTTPIDSSFIYKKNNFIPEDNNFTPTYSIPVTEDPIIASFDVGGTDLTREGPFNAIPTENPISNDENDGNISNDNASGVLETTTTVPVFETTSSPDFETTTVSSPVFETITEFSPAFETTPSVPVFDTTTVSLPPDLIFPDSNDNAVPSFSNDDASFSNDNAVPSFSNDITTVVPDVIDAILNVGTPGNQNIVFGGEGQQDQNLQGSSDESQTNTDIQGIEEVEQPPSGNLAFPQVSTQNGNPNANQQVTGDESQQASEDTQLQSTGNDNGTRQAAGTSPTAGVPFTNDQAERQESSGVQINDATSLDTGGPLNITDEQIDTKDDVNQRPNLASQLPFLELPEGAFGFTVTLGEINNTQSNTEENINDSLQNNTQITTGENTDDQIQDNPQSVAENIDDMLQNSAQNITEISNDRVQTATQDSSTDVLNSQTEEADVSFRQGNDTLLDFLSNDTDILINESAVEDTVPLLNIPGRVEPSDISSQTPVEVLLLGESDENTDAPTSAKGTQGDSGCNDTGDLTHNAELSVDFSSSEEPIILLDSSVELASIEDNGKDKKQDFISLFQDQLDAIRKEIDTRDKLPAQAGGTPVLPVPSVGFTGFGVQNQLNTNILSPTPAVLKVTETTTKTVFVPIVKPTNSPITTKKVPSTLKVQGGPTPKPGIWRPTFGLPFQTQTSRPTSVKGFSKQPSLASFLGGPTRPANFGYGNYNNQPSVGAITTPGQGHYTRPISVYDNPSQQQNPGTYSESQGQTQNDEEREKWVWRNRFSSVPIRGREHEYIKNRPLTYTTNNFAPGSVSQGGSHYAGSTYAQNRPKHTEYGKDSETERWVWTSNRNPSTPLPIKNTWIPDNYLFSPSVVNYVYSRVGSDTSETPVTDSAKNLGNTVTQSGPTATTPYYWYNSHSHTDPRVSATSRSKRSPPTSRHH